MGHLINPMAMRLGRFSEWCDSWYSEFIFYPEFLHDMFRVRMYLTHVLYDNMFFEKSPYFLSHFEFFYKYNYLVARFYYYDGVLMTSFFTFSADFYDRYTRERYTKTRKRSQRLVGSRMGRIFLGLFFSFFRFFRFFKPSYANIAEKSWHMGLAKARCFANRLVSRKNSEISSERWLARLKKRVLKASKQIKIAKKRKRRRRRPTEHFFLYEPLWNFGRFRSSKPRAYRAMFNHAYWWDYHTIAEKLRARAAARRQRFKSLWAKAEVERIERLRRESARRLDAIFAQFKFTKVINVKSSFFIRPSKSKAINKLLGIPKNRISEDVLAELIKPAVPVKKRPFLQAFKFLWRQDFYDMHYASLRLDRSRVGKDSKLLMHKRLFDVLQFTIRFCSMGCFSKLLYAYRDFFYLVLPFRGEFRFFLIFITLFRRAWQVLQFRYRANRLAEFFTDFYFILNYLFFHGVYKISFLTSFFRHMVNIIVPQHVVKIGFFIISNECITARMLSRFIGKKLLQGHKVKDTVIPIMKELFIVAIKSRVTWYGFITKKGTKKDHLLSYKLTIIKSFALKFFYVFKRLYFKFFRSRNSWLTYNCFSFLFSFFEGSSGKAKRSLLVGASQKFLIKRCSFLFFFNFDFSLFFQGLYFVFNELFFDFAYKDTKHSFFFFLIFDDLFSNFNCIYLKKIMFTKIVRQLHCAATIFFFNRLIRYRFWAHGYSWALEVVHLNKLKMRIFRDYSKASVFGYKIHLRGRFSRKQKASSIFYGKGKLPLNTLSATIDYSFSSMAIKNSLVSIKVWFYRNSYYPQWFLREF